MLELPTHIQLEITDLCNLRCQHCYHFDTGNMPVSKDLNDEMLLCLANEILACKPYSLIITGGEPMIRKEMTFRIAEIAKKAGSFVSINTNLLLVNEEIIIRLCDINIDSLLVSCPASDADVYKKITKCGNYETLKKNLKLVLNYGISCMVNMVVTPVNLHLIRNTARDLAKLGIKRFAATPASLNVEYPNLDEMLNGPQTIQLLEDLRWCAEELGLQVDILEPIVKCFLPDWCWDKDYAFMRRACQAGRMSVSIANNGDVRPCSHNPMVYGNLFEDDLRKIWLKMEIYRKEVVPSLCQNCPSVALCNGGCRTNSLAMHKSLSQPDRLMVGHKRTLNKQFAEFKIADSTVLHFNGQLRWRNEFQDYSVSSKIGGANLMIINKELFDFIKWLESKLPLSMKTIKELIDVSDYDDFLKILKLLITKEFVVIEN